MNKYRFNFYLISAYVEIFASSYEDAEKAFEAMCLHDGVGSVAQVEDEQRAALLKALAR